MNFSSLLIIELGYKYLYHKNWSTTEIWTQNVRSSCVSLKQLINILLITLLNSRQIQGKKLKLSSLISSWIEFTLLKLQWCFKLLFGFSILHKRYRCTIQPSYERNERLSSLFLFLPSLSSISLLSLGCCSALQVQGTQPMCCERVILESSIKYLWTDKI